MAFEFKNRKVVVTGGSRGIGRAIALGFAAAGADVSICARGSESLEATRSELARHGHKAHAGACDLADAAALARYVAQAGAALDKLRLHFHRQGLASALRFRVFRRAAFTGGLAGGGGGYSNTPQGKIVTAAFADSYNQMVAALKNYMAQTVKGGLGTGGRLGVSGGSTPASQEADGKVPVKVEATTPVKAEMVTPVKAEATAPAKPTTAATPPKAPAKPAAKTPSKTSTDQKPAGS